MPVETATAIIRLQLPANLLTHFEALASAFNQPVEEVIAQHLERTKSYTDAAPLYLTDSEATEVRKLLGASISTGSKLIEMLKRILSHRIGGRKTILSPSRQEAVYWFIRNSGMQEEQAFDMLVDQAFGLLLKC